MRFSLLTVAGVFAHVFYQKIIFGIVVLELVVVGREFFLLLGCEVVFEARVVQMDDLSEERVQSIFAGPCEQEQRFEVLFRQICRRLGAPRRWASR